MWAIGAIASGLLSGLGADIYKKLKGSNINDMNTVAIYEIGNIVKQVIAESAIKACNDNIDALRIQMEEYLIDPGKNAFRLENAIIESNKLVSRLKGLDVVGLGGFVLAAGLRLAILQERAKSVASEKQSLKARAIEYSNHAQSAVDRMTKQFHARFSECRIRKSGPPGTILPSYPNPDWDWKWSYSLDGVIGRTREGYGSTKEKAQENCLKKKHVEWYNMYMPVMEKGNAIFYTYERWRQLAKSL
jgi:hypothetical protein